MLSLSIFQNKLFDFMFFLNILNMFSTYPFLFFNCMIFFLVIFINYYAELYSFLKYFLSLSWSNLILLNLFMLLVVYFRFNLIMGALIDASIDVGIVADIIDFVSYVDFDDDGMDIDTVVDIVVDITGDIVAANVGVGVDVSGDIADDVTAKLPVKIAVNVMGFFSLFFLIFLSYFYFF